MKGVYRCRCCNKLVQGHDWVFPETARLKSEAETALRLTERAKGDPKMNTIVHECAENFAICDLIGFAKKGKGR